jgi:hypothetical protein
VFKVLFFLTTICCGFLFNHLNQKYTSNTTRERNDKIIKKEEIKVKNYLTKTIASYLIPSFPSGPNVEVKDFLPSIETKNNINDNGSNLMPSFGIGDVDVLKPVELSGAVHSIPSLPPAFQSPNDLKLPIEQNNDQLLDIVNYYQNALKDVQKEVPIALPSI